MFVYSFICHINHPRELAENQPKMNSNNDRNGQQTTTRNLKLSTSPTSSSLHRPMPTRLTCLPFSRVEVTPRREISHVGPNNHLYDTIPSGTQYNIDTKSSMVSHCLTWNSFLTWMDKVNTIVTFLNFLVVVFMMIAMVIILYKVWNVYTDMRELILDSFEQLTTELRVDGKDIFG